MKASTCSSVGLLAATSFASSSLRAATRSVTSIKTSRASGWRRCERYRTASLARFAEVGEMYVSKNAFKSALSRLAMIAARRVPM